jgi:hypothetical protein
MRSFRYFVFALLVGCIVSTASLGVAVGGPSRGVEQGRATGGRVLLEHIRSLTPSERLPKVREYAGMILDARIRSWARNAAPAVIESLRKSATNETSGDTRDLIRWLVQYSPEHAEFFHGLEPGEILQVGLTLIHRLDQFPEPMPPMEAEQELQRLGILSTPSTSPRQQTRTAQPEANSLKDPQAQHKIPIVAPDGARRETVIRLVANNCPVEWTPLHDRSGKSSNRSTPTLTLVGSYTWSGAFVVVASSEKSLGHRLDGPHGLQLGCIDNKKIRWIEPRADVSRGVRVDRHGASEDSIDRIRCERSTFKAARLPKSIRVDGRDHWVTDAPIAEHFNPMMGHFSICLALLP